MVDVIFLSHEQIAELTTVAEHVDAVKDAYRQRGNGAPADPRTALESDDPTGLLNCYVAILPDTGVMGGYTYAAGFGSEDAWLMTPLFDAKTGRPVALLDGAAFNTQKTGAAGAIGIDTLARENSSVLSVFGSGAQARGQVLAATEVRDFNELLVYSPTKEHRESFASEMNDLLPLEARAVDTSSDAVRAADVIVTATTASEPVFAAEELQPGTHINAIGQYHPEKRELSSDVVRRSTYVIDLQERAFQDAGSFLLAVEEGAIDEDHIHCEVGDILAGTAEGRTNSEEITVFDSGGTAIETVASAGLVYQKARERELGKELSFMPASHAYEGKKRDTADELR